MTRAARLLLPTVAAVILLAPPHAAAQRKGGGGRHGAQPPPRAEESAAEAPGGYGFSLVGVQQAFRRGEGRQALAAYERAAADAERGGDGAALARALAATTFAAERLGLHQKAVRDGGRALDLYRAQPPSDATAGAMVSLYATVGGAWLALRDVAQARRVLEEGLAFASANTPGHEHGAGAAKLARGLSRTAYVAKDYATARVRGEQAVHIIETLIASNRRPDRLAAHRRLAAYSLVTVGRAELALGRAAEAQAAFERAREYARLAPAPEVEGVALGASASVALQRNDFAAALALYQDSLRLAASTGNVTDLILLHSGAARSLAGLGRQDEALAAARRAIALIEDVRAELGEPELRSTYLEDKQAIYHTAVHMALRSKHPDEAFELAERSRARAFLDLLGNRTTLSKGRTRALVDEEVALRARIAEARAAAAEAEDDNDVRRARAAAETADRAYRAFLDRVRKESLEQTSLMSVQPVTLAETQALLPESTALLEYFVSGREILVWVVERNATRVVRLPVERSALLAEVQGFRTAIADRAALADVERRARGLYDTLVAKALPAVRGDRLLIVPHDVLHYLPFAALRDPDGRWLVERYTLTTLPSASVLKYLGDKGAAAGAATLAIGNPDLGPGLELRFAEREARVVAAERGPAATVLVRGEATEARAKALLGAAGIVHFATHGELSEDDPLSSALLLAPGGGEDGRLEVREVLGLDMHARLVVLSACETGLGKLSRGDELVGLQRAFLYAGTPTVVTTLWKVDDRASFELVRVFYARLAAADSAPALRQAQMETMKQYAHPFAWAAFVLTGTPR
jgi:CHAT domain-containing protein